MEGGEEGVDGVKVGDDGWLMCCTVTDQSHLDHLIWDIDRSPKPMYNMRP